MRKIALYLSLLLFVSGFLNSVFAETILKWKGKSYDFEGASITSSLNQAGAKPSTDMMDQMAFKTIMQNLCSDFIKCFPNLDNWNRFLMAFPTFEMARRELEFYSIDQDTALKIYQDFTSGKLVKQEWIIRKVRITNPELLARTFPEDPEFALKDDKRINSASKGSQRSKPRLKAPVFLFLEESEVVRSVFADLEFVNDHWKDVFEKETKKLFDAPVYK